MGKSYKERYFQDYHIEKRTSKNGKWSRMVYVYHGAYVQWSKSNGVLTRGALRLHKLLYTLLLCASICLYAAAALQDSPATKTASAVIPGVISLPFLVFEAIGIARFCLSGRRMTSLDAGEINRCILASSAGHALLLLAAAVLSAAVLLKAGDALFVPLLYLASAVCSAALFFCQRRLQIHAA